MERPLELSGRDALVLVNSTCSTNIILEDTYDNILRLVDDPDVKDIIRFLRQREIVHFQRFGEALDFATEQMDSRNIYAFNPGLKKQP